MTLRSKLSKRLFDGDGVTSPMLILRNSSIRSSWHQTPAYREYLSPRSSDDKTFFRRFLQRRAIYQSPSRLPELLALPVGDKLRKKIGELFITRERLQLEGISPPTAESSNNDSLSGISINEARKILRISQMEKLKARLRNIPKSSISYSEFVRLCFELCENEVEGNEFAKILDESGNVIVLGNVVFLRPEQVARSMEDILSQSMATPNDPRKKELEEMEKQKAIIDQKAQAQVRVELYCGLGLMLGQTLVFMRLTFWELSWDVMEPICFFVASLHSAIGYGFFIRTSTEPTFEGYFHRRFKAKQEKLMDIYNFDIHKYNELRQLCCNDLSK